MQAIADVLHEVPEDEPETAYLRRLATQVNRGVLDKNRALAADLSTAHAWIRRVAACLRYPVSAEEDAVVTAQQVKEEMAALLKAFQPDLKRSPAQRRLHHAWHHAWETYGEDLLICYDIPGMPQDNLGLEALFGRLRGHQRRISGRGLQRAS